MHIMELYVKTTVVSFMLLIFLIDGLGCRQKCPNL